MADNRQFTDHNEIGGVNVYLEDKKLAESPEKNTVASTDYVLLKDEDNIPRKISKANLMSVVKDAIGELLKSNDLGTSVTNVPALNASAFGSATVTNLASVLGVHGLKINFIKTSNTNIDTAETGTYISNSQPNIANGGGTLPTGVMPGGNYVIVHVSTFTNDTDFGYQEYLSFNYQNGNMKKWHRVKTVDGWQSWVLEFENV